jgi:hypothetical protein
MAEKSLVEYFQICGRNIMIPFDVYFSSTASEYNEFILIISSKKTYSKIAQLIVDENNKILNINHKLAENFIYKYFTLKLSIDNDRYREKSPKTFISDIITTLFTEDIMQIINGYVKEQYNTNIDSAMNIDRQKFDMGTTFLDRHYEVMYKVSSMSRLIIPLITHYLHNMPEINTNNFIMDVFQDLFSIAQLGTNIDVYAKLHTAVSRAVQRTLYTDKVMWDRLMILGVTKDNAINDTMCKLIINVMPKYSYSMNIMNLNTVVIRKSIMSYTLRKKDPYTLYSLTDSDGNASDDDSIISETEIFDSYNTQRDESIILIRKYATTHDIEVIREREGVIISKDEIEFYSLGKRYHEFQKSAICSVFARYFGGVENIIGGCRKEDWIRLIIILMKSMERLGMTYLVHFVPAIRQNYAYKRLSKFLENQINNDPLYLEIVEKKYKSIKGIFEKKNFIKGMIISIINNAYIYNTYGDPRNGTFIEKDEQRIIQEVLRFFLTLII